MAKGTFSIVRYGNRNGSVSWRVTGTLSGVQIRRNFKTREEAAAEKATLEIQATQVAGGLRLVGTTLPESLIREVEVVYQRIPREPGVLMGMVEFALANRKASIATKKVADAIDDYVQARGRECREGHIAKVQFRRIRSELKHLAAYFQGCGMDAITPSRLIGNLERGNPSLKTYNNRRGIVSPFMKHAYVREWISENPVQRIPNRRIRRRKGTAATYSAVRAQESSRR